MEDLTIEQLNDVIDKKDVPALRKLFDEYNSVDIAGFMNELPLNKSVFVFTTVPSSLTADVFAYLDEDYQEDVIELLKEADLKKILAELYSDDIADVYEQLPANLARKVLKSVDKDARADINKLLSYKDDSAGTLMTIEYVELKEDDTCAEAIRKIRKMADDVETISYAYVVDKTRNLVGYLPLKEILKGKDYIKIGDIMEKDIISVNVDDDKENVAAEFKKYDLSSIAVVNKDNKMLGIITADDIIDVIDEEATEDIEKMNKMMPLEEDYFKVNVFKMFRKRIVWLVILMCASAISAFVLSKAEATISAVAVLAVFMPMITDTAGNAGSQTTALLVRGLSLGTIKTKDFFKAVLKEFSVGLLVGAALGAFCFCWLWFENTVHIISVPENSYAVFAAVAASVCLVVMVSKTLATVLPLTAKLLKLDPAVMAGPLVTTIADATAILIYFTIAKQFLLPLFS